MKLDRATRLLTASLALGLCGAFAVAAREEREVVDAEYGIGLYLGHCGSLVAGAALYDLGDAELETEEYGDDGTPTLEDVLEEESDDDETAVEEAIGEEEGGGLESSDEEVVVQDDGFLVWVNTGARFGADLAELVDAPFAVAVRGDARDGAEADGDDASDFLACGTFGGVVAGNEIVIPLRPLNGSGLGGVSVLRRGEEEGVSSLYLYREETATPEPVATPVAEGSPAAEGTPDVEGGSLGPATPPG